jgi:hypothetical protein
MVRVGVWFNCWMSVGGKGEVDVGGGEEERREEKKRKAEE